MIKKYDCANFLSAAILTIINLDKLDNFPNIIYKILIDNYFTNCENHQWKYIKKIIPIAIR